MQHYWIFKGEIWWGHEMLDWRRITDRRELETTTLCLIYSSGTRDCQRVRVLEYRFRIGSDSSMFQGFRSHTLNMVAEQSSHANLIKAQLKVHNPNFQYRTLDTSNSHIAGMQGYFVNPFYMVARHIGCPSSTLESSWNITGDTKSHSFSRFANILLIAKSPAVKDLFDHLEQAITGADLWVRAAVVCKLRSWEREGIVSQTWGLSESTGVQHCSISTRKIFLGSVSRMLRICQQGTSNISP